MARALAFPEICFRGSDLRVSGPPVRTISCPSDLYQVHGRSPRTLEAAGAQYTELFGRLADLRKLRGAMSPTRGPAIDSHSVSGVVPQYQEEQAATLPSNEFPWHGVRLQEHYCYPLSSETAVLCCLPQSLHPQGSQGLEGLPQTHGPYGSNGTDSPSGPSSHAPCSEVSPKCRPVSTEPRPCQGDGFPKALESPTLVEGPSQHQERADHGVSDSPPDRIYRRIPSRLGSRTQR